MPVEMTPISFTNQCHCLYPHIGTGYDIQTSYLNFSHKNRATTYLIKCYYLLQPYRTTALVLPGAKVSRDPAPTMSYLRHHPNPMMRSRPAEYEWVPADIVKKQQVF